MIDKVIVIKNKLGLHARPSALFVQATGRFKSSIKVIRDNQEVDGKSIMGLMMLAAGQGTELRFLINGPDETELLTVVEDLINRKFEEE
ncbi:MAG: phosphocarrier protein HPr [Elusimicrobia bacterium RIFOXYC2_FULL_34_12]|nr:MAG: phosphocarrier protein HPr [Elusimicrobia bacterium RIFOXYC2_FULL_34_12]OGS38693.1 MAG: phosphocarrier protein HPr [Elusimicrobia bacterium RIFOXYD2_FULL_34_30]HAM39409.1 HPr family phosphocarrier protein [Elusimicrobiota bacterium]